MHWIDQDRSSVERVHIGFAHHGCCRLTNLPEKILVFSDYSHGQARGVLFMVIACFRRSFADFGETGLLPEKKFFTARQPNGHICG